jgi:hypothetical protein
MAVYTNYPLFMYYSLKIMPFSHISHPGKACFLAGKSWFLKKKGIVVEHEWISRCVFAKGEEKFT